MRYFIVTQDVPFKDNQGNIYPITPQLKLAIINAAKLEENLTSVSLFQSLEEAVKFAKIGVQPADTDQFPVYEIELDTTRPEKFKLHNIDGTALFYWDIALKYIQKIYFLKAHLYHIHPSYALIYLQEQPSPALTELPAVLVTPPLIPRLSLNHELASEQQASQAILLRRNFKLSVRLSSYLTKKNSASAIGFMIATWALTYYGITDALFAGAGIILPSGFTAFNIAASLVTSMSIAGLIFATMVGAKYGYQHASKAINKFNEWCHGQVAAVPSDNPTDALVARLASRLPDQVRATVETPAQGPSDNPTDNPTDALVARLASRLKKPLLDQVRATAETPAQNRTVLLTKSSHRSARRRSLDPNRVIDGPTNSKRRLIYVG